MLGHDGPAGALDEAAAGRVEVVTTPTGLEVIPAALEVELGAEMMAEVDCWHLVQIVEVVVKRTVEVDKPTERVVDPEVTRVEVTGQTVVEEITTTVVRTSDTEALEVTPATLEVTPATLEVVAATLEEAMMLEEAITLEEATTLEEAITLEEATTLEDATTLEVTAATLEVDWIPVHRVQMVDQEVERMVEVEKLTERVVDPEVTRVEVTGQTVVEEITTTVVRISETETGVVEIEDEATKVVVGVNDVEAAGLLEELAMMVVEPATDEVVTTEVEEGEERVVDWTTEEVDGT
jgi:hypothetical protein